MELQGRIEKMTNIAKNIRYLRLKNEMSQDELAKRLGKKSYTTIQKWESGVSEPSVKITTQIADIFGIGIDELTGKDLQLKSAAPSDAVSVRIPVLGRVAAGIPLDAVEEIIDYEEIPKSMAADGEYFGLRIKGDSMEPKISNGDVVIVRKQDTADDGDLVIALVNGDEGCCKRLKKYGNGIALVSTNPAYDPMYFSADEVGRIPVRIIGKVKELRAKF